MENSRLNAAELFAVLSLLFLSTHVFAQPVEPSELINKLDTSSLEYYLDKADIQPLREQWLSYSRFGLNAALSVWEQEIFLLMGEDFDIAPLRLEAEEKLNTLIEDRLTVWLSGRFFDQVPPPSLGELDKEIDNLNRSYLYEKDENGNLLRDADGNFIYKTTAGYEDLYTVDASGNKSLVSKGEKRLWTEGVKAVIDELLASWEKRTITAHDELLASVSEPQLLTRLETTYKGDFNSYSRAFRRQLYRLYYIEQSMFTKLRLYDQRSLEYLSGEETAVNVSNRLISETQTSLDSQMNALFQGLNARVGEVQYYGGVIDGETWQESFRNLLEEGLSSWDAAEENLLMERVEWEQTAGKEISEGEKAWAEAFSVLQVKRSEWMSTYRQTLEEGNKLWAEESLELETAIDNAVAELDAGIENSRASLQSRTDNLIGMLLQSVNMMRTARSSWEYWMDQYDGGEKGSFDCSDVDFDIWSMRRKNIEEGYSSITSFGDAAAVLNAFEWLEENYSGEAETFWTQNLSPADKEAVFSSYKPYSLLTGAARTLKLGAFSSALDDIFEKVRGLQSGTIAGSASLKEAFYWAELLGTYQSYARSSQDSLAETYGIVVFDNSSLRTAFNGEELDRALLDDNLLYEGEAWESLYLDGWQVELLKAGAYMQYWERQQEIAQKVYDYAADNSSTKEGAAVTKARLDKAKMDYDSILNEYNGLIESLSNIAINLEEKQEGMAAIQAEIDGYQSQLSEARAEYKETLTDLFVGNPDYLSDQYLTFYKELLISYGMDSGKQEDGLGTVFEEYLLAAQKYGLENSISLLSERVICLLSGDETAAYDDPVFNPGTAGLSELHDRMLVTSEAGFADVSEGENPGFCFIGDANLIHDFNEYLKDSLFLKPDDYRFIQMNELFDEYHNPDWRIPAEILWDMQLIVREIKDKCVLDYETRLAEIRLHTTDDFPSFAARYFSDTEIFEGASESDIFNSITSLADSPLAGILPSIACDIGVYSEIISLYNLHIDSGNKGDFILYDWSPGGPGSPDQLNKFQAYQKIWDYRKELLEIENGALPSDDDIFSEIILIVESLTGLKVELENAGNLSEYTEEFETALLDSVSGERLNFLGNYLGGGHSLIASEGDMYSFIFNERISDEYLELAIAELVRQSISTAPVLSQISHEQSYNSLLGFLADEGIIEPGTKTFRAPAALWRSKKFSSAAEVSAWFYHLDTEIDALSMPSYLREILTGCITELKDYSAVKAAACWGGDIPVDLTGLNEEIRSLSTALAEGQAVIKSLQAGGDDVLKLRELAVSGSVPAALASSSEDRFYDTAGFDLARKALLDEGFDDTSASWDRLLDEYLTDIKLSAESGIDSHTNEMLSRAMDSYSLANAVANPEEIDWSTAPDGWLEIYQASLWNSLDFDEALSLITAERSTVDIQELQLLRRIDGQMPVDTAHYDEVLGAQAPTLSRLAALPEGGLYADILSYSLGAVLLDGGYSSDEAVSLISWFLGEKGVSVEPDAGMLQAFTDKDAEERLWFLLEGEPESAVHYLKKNIINGGYTASSLEERLAGLNRLSSGDKQSLVELLKLQNDIRIYRPLLHGSFEEYLNVKYAGDDDLLQRQRSQYYRFRMNPAGQWDDPVFMAGTIFSGLDASAILENIAFNKTRSLNNFGLNPQSVLSSNDVFLSAAAEILNKELWSSSGSLSDDLAVLYARRELSLRAAAYIESVDSADSDHWRSFLTEEYLASAAADENFIPLENIDVAGEDYVRNLVIDENSGPAIGEFFGLHLFTGTGDDQDNFILDVGNSYLDHAAFLASAVSGWTADEGVLQGSENLTALAGITAGDPGEDFWNYLDTAGYGRIADDYGFTPDAVLNNDLSRKLSDFICLLSGIDALKAGLGSLGSRKEKLIRLSGQPDEAVAAALSPLREKIIAAENSISAAENDWQQLLGGAGGYRELETEYARVYGETRTSLYELDQLKHEYSIARAIYEYASAGYLSIDEETISGSLGELIDQVSPARRLTYVSDKFTRAEAAFDALSSIINENKEDYSIYGKDEVYRAFFDSYMTSFRESLVLSKMNLVLNKAVARQETLVLKALTDLNNDLRESYNPVNIRDGNNKIVIPDSFSGLKLAQNTDGSWTIGWGDGKPAGVEASGYFEIQADSKTGRSCFEDDQLRWLEAVDVLQRQDLGEEIFTRWAMSRRWEEWEEMGEAEQIAYIDAILTRNGEEDLDREGGKAVLLAAWQSSYENVHSGSPDERWMYDFYKLLEVSGTMQVDTTAAGMSASENLSVLADEESLILANEYMAEKFKQNAQNIMASSIPVFAMAAYYFTLGTISLAAVPFGWIAAIAIFAMASFMTATATMILGDGTTRLAAAKDLQEEVVDPSKSSKSRFLSDFKNSTVGIIKSQIDYERELAKLEIMKGGFVEGENLTDSGQIENLKNSVIDTFNEEGEDLHSLLVLAGLVDSGGGTAADLSALDSLFGSCQSRMSETEKNECRSSSSFISALENEAREKKQISSRELNDYLNGSGGAAGTQQDVEDEYQRAYFRYIKEEITLDELKQAALQAWGNPVFSMREHLLRLYEGQSEIAGLIMGSDQFNSDISRELLEDQKLLLTGSGRQQGIYDYRQESYREVRLYEMQMLKLEMAERRALWENQMSAVTARGQLEWSAGERNLRRNYEDWMDETRRAYRKQKDCWNDKYADFLSDKQKWFDAVTIQSTDYGNMNVFENFGSMTEGSIAAAGADILIGSMSEISISPDAVLNEVLNIELLDKLLENARSLNEGITDINLLIFTEGGSSEFTTAGSLQTIKNFQGLQNEEYEKHLAVIGFNRLLERVEYAEETFIEQIENANAGVADGLHRTMRNDGYTLKGSRYERRLVVGCSLADYIYDVGYVSTYDYYTAENVDFSGGLEDAAVNIDNMDAGSLEGLVDEAMDDIEDETRRIFGDEDDMSSYLLAELGLTETLVDGETAFEREEISAQKKDAGIFETILNWLFSDSEIEDGEGSIEADDPRYVDVSPGLFGLHIGFSPAFSDSPDLEKVWNAEGQLKYVGAGEMGRIMGEFVFNKYRENAGWTEVNLPHYKKRLFDDTDSLIAAPTMEDVTGIITTVLTAGAGGALGVWESMAVNLADDFAFTASDVEQGEMSWDEGLVSFGQKAAGAALGTLGGSIFGDLGDDAGLTDQIFNNAAKQTYSNLTGSMVNSITYTNAGGFSFNASAFDEGVFGRGAIAGYVGGAAGLAAEGFLTGTMDAAARGFYGSLGTIGNMAASEASKYAVYAGYQLAEDGFDDIGSSMGSAFDAMGGLSVNVLDIGSILDLGRLLAASGADDYNDGYLGGLSQVARNLKGTGLFALNFNSNGITGEITTGGLGMGSCLYDFGKGTIADLAIQNYSRENGNANLLKTGYAFGDQNAEDTIWRLLSGKDSLYFNADSSEEGQTIKKISGGRAIHLGSQYYNADGDELLKASILLQHEAHRDGIVSGNNDAETLRAVLAHTQMAGTLGRAYGFDYIAGNSNLIGDVSVYMAALQLGDMSLFTDYVEGTYDSTADYWKVILDDEGKAVKVLDDGDKNTITLVDEDGNIKSVKRNDGSSLSGQIASYAALFQKKYGVQEKSDINSIMVLSGLDYNSDAGWHAVRPEAFDYGSGYDPVYNAIRNGNYSEIKNIVSNLNQNSSTDISQEMVEQALGLDAHTACAIAANAEMVNNYLQSKYGVSLSPAELVEVLGNSQGEMFNDEGWVLSFNGINAMAAAEIGIDNYPVFYREYDSLEALQADGIEFYLEKFVNSKDPDRTHFGSWSNDEFDDPDTTTGNRWWLDSDLYDPTYYGFKPKY